MVIRRRGEDIPFVCEGEDTMKARIVILLLIAAAAMGMVRYQVGIPISRDIYTEPFDANDPAYKFFVINYGEPNAPKLQSAPDDWIKMCGDNERTLIFHAVSELRVAVAIQSKRILELEKWKDEQPFQGEIPYMIFKEIEEWMEAIDKKVQAYQVDPNEAK